MAQGIEFAGETKRRFGFTGLEKSRDGFLG